jgi:hypothetical protein
MRSAKFAICYSSSHPVRSSRRHRVGVLLRLRFLELLSELTPLVRQARRPGFARMTRARRENGFERVVQPCYRSSIFHIEDAAASNIELDEPSLHLAEDLLSHREHLRTVVQPVAVDGMAASGELSALVPTTKCRFAHAQKARRLLDREDLRKVLVVRLSRHVENLANLDQHRQRS